MTKYIIRPKALLTAAFIMVSILGGCKDNIETSGSSFYSDITSDISSEVSAITSTTETSSQSTSKAAGSSKTTTSSTPVKSEKDSNAGVKKDFGGQTFIIAGVWAKNYFPEYGKSEEGDALLAHIEEIESKYNCVLKFKTGSRENIINDFTAACLANSYYADIIEGQLWESREWIRKGYIAPMDGMKSMNISDEKYIKSYTNLCKYDGRSYGTNFTGWYYKLPLFNIGGMLFNIDLLKEYKQPNPWDLIKSGKWTWDEYRKICKAVTKDTDGDGKTNIWGSAKEMLYPALWSTGKNVITWDSKNKRWAFGYANSSIYSAIQLTIDMLHTDKSIAFGYEKTDPHYGMSELFGKGKAAFLPCDLEWITYGTEDVRWILDMEDDYGFVPFPLSPDNKSGAYKGMFSGNTRVFMIPKTAKKVEDAAFIFDRWTQPFKGTNSSSWKDYVKDEFFRGYDKSFDYYYQLLMNAQGTMEADLGHLQTVPLELTLQSAIFDRKFTPAEAIALERTSYNAYLDQYVNSDKKLLK